MRFQTTVLAVAASLAFASAQDLSNVPQCAIPCFVAALPASKCGATDIQCQCTTGREPMQQSLMACVPTKCSQEDALKIIPAVSGLCAQAGITLSDIPTATATGGNTPAATPGRETSATPTPSGSKPSATGSGSPPQSTGAASGNAVALGAVAVGLAAAFGL